MKFAIPVIVLSGLLTVSSNSVGDVLLIDSIQEAPINSTEGIPRPTRGMTMDRVKRQFGDPSSAHPRVGEPPITRWDYPEYSVFFEYQHVLTSVIHR